MNSSDRLAEEEIEQYLVQYEGWKRKEIKWLEKKFRFGSFLEAIQFVNKIALISEDLRHHPFISIDYKLVTLKLTTWKAGGITSLDFTSISQYEQVYEQLRDNQS